MINEDASLKIGCRAI